MHSCAWLARRRMRGQSLVETGMRLAVVLLLGWGVTDIGRAFYSREAVTNSTRQALRVAVSPSQQATADAICSGTGSGPLAVTVTSPIPPSGGSIATIANEAALESSNNGTPAGSVIAGATLSVTFHCLNGAAVTNANANGGGAPNAGGGSVTPPIPHTLRTITPPPWPGV